MGTILLERVVQQCRGGQSIVREREWRRKATDSNTRPNVDSNNLGRRQSQRKPRLPQYPFPCQENNNVKRPQQRRMHKPKTPPTKHNDQHQHGAQETSESHGAEDRMQPAVQPVPHSSREHKHNTGPRGSRHRHRLPESSPHVPERTGPGMGHGQGDSDSDLSQSERLPEERGVSPSGRVPPQLELRPEVFEEAEDRFSPRGRHGPRGRVDRGFNFPDFLPPPFNSWSLAQLAVFYNTEGPPRPRPVGPLDRYLDGLLKLEWLQIQTVQEESGKTLSEVSDITSTCHRGPSSVCASSRLSSPKCILQCQRTFFPLTFLSSLAGHSALLLSGCACTLCRIRFSACCHGHSHSYHGRQASPTPQRPRRSYSESRVHSSAACGRTGRLSSPTRTNSSQHLRRMQASGNIRNPDQGANTKPQSTANTKPQSTANRDGSVSASSTARTKPLGAQGDVMLDHCRTGDLLRRRRRRRTVSEQRKGGGERHRGVSECRRAETTAAGLTRDQEVKPDAVTAIMDNLPCSKNFSVKRPNRPKQVEFVT